MKVRMYAIYGCVTLLFGIWVLGCSMQNRISRDAEITANPQMERLARAFAGKWKTHEEFAKNVFYPHGAQRDGTADFTLASGGTSLIESVHSDGTAGRLDFVVVIWWDATDNNYKMFTCGNAGANPCHMRGTARWDGDRFINEFELTIRGQSHEALDSFERISAKTMTLVASAALDSDGMKPIITTTYLRE